MNNRMRVSVLDKIATKVCDTTYVCGNSDYVIDFTFDAEWDDYTIKTARFVPGNNRPPIDVVFEGNSCEVPVISNTLQFRVGVFAGDLHTTTPACVPAKKSILCESGTPEEPASDVYAQIMEKINDLEADVPPEQIEAAVNKYLKENPVETGVTEEQLVQAVESALAEAKATGEFDGEDGKDGYTPVKGVDYFDGERGEKGDPGYTPIKGVDYFDGADGKPGTDGYTPVKGVDYFDGKNGADGGYYTPNVNSNGILTWTASKTGMPSVAGANIKGADGKTPVKGIDYNDGAPGYTPQKNVDYFDGKDGSDGAPGADGYSPTVTLTRVSDGVQIDVQNKDGTQTATVYDGKDGEGGGTGGLPEGGEPNTMLVTDGDGNVKWDARTHWTENCGVIDILPETTLDGEDGQFAITEPFAGEIVAGQTYTVMYDGADYTCTAIEFAANGVSFSVLGNAIMVGGEDTGEPFAIAYVPLDYVNMVGAYGMVSDMTGAASATVRIQGAVEIVHPLDPKYLSNLRGQKKIEVDLTTGIASVDFSVAWAMDMAELQASLSVIVTDENDSEAVRYYSVYGLNKREYVAAVDVIQFSVRTFSDTGRPTEYLCSWYSASRNRVSIETKHSVLPVSSEGSFLRGTDSGYWENQGKEEILKDIGLGFVYDADEDGLSEFTPGLVLDSTDKENTDKTYLAADGTGALYAGKMMNGFLDGKKVLTEDDTEAVIESALAEAKASGEFKGDKGDTGAPGAAGYTPVRGTDYWTSEDISSIVNQTANLVVEQRYKRTYKAPENFGATNDSTLLEIITKLPEGSSVTFWINDTKYGNVYSEIKEQTAKIGQNTPYGIVTLTKYSNVTRVKWESYLTLDTLVNSHTTVNNKGWAGWKILAMDDLPVT